MDIQPSKSKADDKKKKEAEEAFQKLVDTAVRDAAITTLVLRDPMKVRERLRELRS